MASEGQRGTGGESGAGKALTVEEARAALRRVLRDIAKGVGRSHVSTLDAQLDALIAVAKRDAFEEAAKAVERRAEVLGRLDLEDERDAVSATAADIRALGSS